MIVLIGDISGIGVYISAALSIIPLILVISIEQYKIAWIYGLLILTSELMGYLVIHLSGGASIALLFLSGIITRFLPGAIMGYYIVQSTTVSEFISAMKRMRISDKIVIPFAVMFRFIPTIIDENHSIGMAMKMRGIGLGGKRSNLIELIEYRMVPVIMATVRVGNELSAAALTKGLDTDQKRTSICNIGFHMADYGMVIYMLTCIVLFIVNKCSIG